MGSAALGLSGGGGRLGSRGSGAVAAGSGFDEHENVSGCCFGFTLNNGSTCLVLAYIYCKAGECLLRRVKSLMRVLLVWCGHLFNSVGWCFVCEASVVCGMA